MYEARTHFPAALQRSGFRDLVIPESQRLRVITEHLSVRGQGTNAA